ncbi:MAG: hypothetical protein E7577_06020 [Ruminococcaceae bacterium]|nr:hypothetical protein [Oscillospiraceae bacterium]
MTPILTAEQRKFIQSYLEEYGTSRKLLRLESYENQFLGGAPYSEPDIDILSEAPFARAKMYGVRHFILSIKNGDEKLFLYYRYVKGEPMERCAELLGVSERSVYRLQTRALTTAYNLLSSAQ